MRFASFEWGGQPCYGRVSGDTVYPVDEDFLARCPDLCSVLAAGALSDVQSSASAGLPLDAVRFEPVIPLPGRIICVGMNYRAHTAELQREQPPAPSLFVRFPDSVVGHERPLVRPVVSEQFDFEGELAAIIGRPAWRIPAADALDYVAGYSCFLDGSVRDYQYQTSQFTAGKNFYRSGAFGPWLVTTDEIPDPQSLTIETRVSGDGMQHGRTSQMVFPVARIIEFLSVIFPLAPGDVIATGTPSGIGAARKPPRWLVAGDVVEVEIEGIGVLRNTVTDE